MMSDVKVKDIGHKAKKHCQESRDLHVRLAC